jgi:hypothetical protein
MIALIALLSRACGLLRGVPIRLWEALMASRKTNTLGARSKPDPRAVFATAEQFWRGANTLAEGLTTGDQSAWVAMIACQAFALELYFKCLALQEGKDILDSHSLSRLYKVLNGKTQNEIRRRGEPLVAQAAKHLGKQRDFDSALKVSSDAFMKVRYLYEGVKPGSGWMCSGVMRVTRDLILERNPTWNPTYIQLPDGLNLFAYKT